MNRVVVDQNGFEYFRFLGADPKMKYQDGQQTGAQDMDENGVPLFNILCLAKAAGASKPETITVKVPMAGAPALDEFAKIAFANLSAYAYASGNRAQLSFSADKVGKARE